MFSRAEAPGFGSTRVTLRDHIGITQHSLRSQVAVSEPADAGGGAAGGVLCSGRQLQGPPRVYNRRTFKDLLEQSGVSPLKNLSKKTSNPHNIPDTKGELPLSGVLAVKATQTAN